MDHECMITTFDNPYNPFEQFTLWHLFDKEKGYDSSERVMRLANISDDMTQKEVDEEIERAIDLLIEIDFTNTYKKLTRNSQETTQSTNT